MKTHLLLMLLLAAFMLVACQDDDIPEEPADNPPQEEQTMHTVEILDSSFSPQDLNISEGDTVTWINYGDMVHTSTSGTNCDDDGRWSSGELVPEASFSYVFTTAGTFDYFCIPHCETGMTGTVTVED